MNFDWKALVQTVAPALATALGGPLAGLAVQTISTAVLGKPDGTEEEISAAIQSGGADALIEIKKANNEFAVKMKELGIRLEELENEDRANARQREIDTGDVWTPRLLTLFVTIGFFAVLFTLINGGVPERGGDALLVMLGSLGTAWAACVAYYVGTTAAGARKTEIIARAEAVK